MLVKLASPQTPPPEWEGLQIQQHKVPLSPGRGGFRRRGRNSPEKNQLPDNIENMTIFPKSGHILALF
jgi:hypothetical protein